jgi:hypothetical protein
MGIDRAHGLIRTWDASTANAYDGARLPLLISPANTASGVWADTAHRTKKNEAILAKGMFTSNTPSAKAAPPCNARTYLARQREAIGGALPRRARLCRAEAPHGLIMRTIGIARARIKIGMAHLAYNIQRLAWLEGRTAPA